MGSPPFGGAVQLIVAEEFPPVAVTLVGGPGRVPGVTTLDSFEFCPVPTELVAATEKAYELPLVKPGKVTFVCGGEPVTVMLTWDPPVSPWFDAVIVSSRVATASVSLTN